MQLEVKIVPVSRGGTSFVAEPSRLHLGGKGAEQVDSIHFALPAEWTSLAVTLHIEWKSGEMPAPIALEADRIATVTRSFTGALTGRWMLMAVGEDGYKACSRPAVYDCYDVLTTDAEGIEIAPTLYEQFVNQVLSYANSALNSSKDAAASAAKVQVDQEQMDRYASAAAASAEAAASAAQEAATEAAAQTKAALCAAVQENADAAAASASAAAASAEAAARSEDDAADSASAAAALASDARESASAAADSCRSAAANDAAATAAQEAAQRTTDTLTAAVAEDAAAAAASRDAAAASESNAAASAAGAAQSAAAAKTSENGAAESAAAAAASASAAANSAEAASTSEGNAAASAMTSANKAAASSSSATDAASSAAAAAESERIAAEYMEQVKTITTGAMGYYATPEALQGAVPLGSDGWWAVVGSTDTIWVWDSDRGAWVDSGDMSGYIPYDLIGMAGGLATLDDNGKLAAGQLPAIDHYTQAETDTKLREAVAAHNSAADAHPDIRASVNSLKAAVQTIELKYGTSIKENAFQVSFETLDDVNAAGVWNQALATIEF